MENFLKGFTSFIQSFLFFGTFLINKKQSYFNHLTCFEKDSVLKTIVFKLNITMQFRAAAYLRWNIIIKLLRYNFNKFNILIRYNRNALSPYFWVL